MGIKKSSQQLIFLTDPLGFRRASKTSHEKQANCLPQTDGKTNTVGFGSVFSQRTNTSFTRERFRHFFFLTQEQKAKMSGLAQRWIPTGFVLKYHARSDSVPLRSVCAANGWLSKRRLG